MGANLDMWRAGPVRSHAGWMLDRRGRMEVPKKRLTCLTLCHTLILVALLLVTLASLGLDTLHQQLEHLIHQNRRIGLLSFEDK